LTFKNIVNIILSSNKQKILIVEKIEKVKNGIFKVPVKVPSCLEPKRSEFEKYILQAQEQLWNFALKYKWTDFLKSPLIHQAEIYNNKSEFINKLKQIVNNPLLLNIKGFSACIENKSLLIVTPELYRKIYPQADEKNAYIKLITHELAHQLHIRILNGNEDKMGPVWFFEGFALYAAGQFENSIIKDKSEIWKIIKGNERVHYKKYSAIIRYFFKKIPLEVLVEKAGDEDFLDWLEKRRN